MSKFVARSAEAVRIIRRTLRKDLLRRRLKHRDSSLPLPSGHRWTVFEGSETVQTRRLPARAVELMDPWQYQRSLQAAVLARLHDARIAFLEIPHASGGPPRLAVREADWRDMLAAITREATLSLIAPLGRPGRRIAETPLSPLSQAPSYAEEACIALLAPAATHARGKIRKRYGFECAVIVERWSPNEEGELESPFWNPVTSLLPESIWPGQQSTPAVDPAPFGPPHLFQPDFDIDVVYTWVDGTDDEWLSRKRAALEALAHEPLTEDAAADLRFVGHDELRYSLRSIEQYAPWVRHIWIVTDQQRPGWLREDHPRITIVDHRDIAPPDAVLPTFNSHAIEANLHRIDGLAEHFLYFNDDVFLSSFVPPDLFFSANGLSHMFLSRARVAQGAPRNDEPASDTAGKNARMLVEQVCGRRISRKLFHTPFALQRSVSEAIERRWPDAVAATRAAPFRTINDITLSGAMHMNYAFATGRAVTRGVRYRYVNIGAQDAPERLDRLYRDRFRLQTFCLNEATQDVPAEEIDRTVRAFLHRRFPDMSSFEVLE